MWMEFTNVVMKEQFRNRLPVEWQSRFALARWQDAAVRRRYLESQVDALEQLLDQFPWSEVSLTPQVRSTAIRLVSLHNLRSYDAVHVASAFAAGCIDFASFDETFRRVDGLVLWNDLIHAGKPG
jgi:predicted nucleic acid-binding protein